MVRRNLVSPPTDGDPNMILAISLVDGDRESSELVQSCEDFFNSENIGLTDQELTIQLKSLGCDLIAFSHGLVNALHSGHFV